MTICLVLVRYFFRNHGDRLRLRHDERYLDGNHVYEPYRYAHNGGRRRGDLDTQYGIIKNYWESLLLFVTI